ncbi:MAG: DUF2804 domain-containing protein [Clostridium sp.]|uniref:DUF2804 domain-containing protein n=1 Tax=Clostridium sp. TaxID=1506 RepID=UPI002907C311|nr:DUF2804 domain-containing protein [Clostridium sp.]MDU6363479.1 DUF2804 domain-containing protein [Clostridium sp.]
MQREIIENTKLLNEQGNLKQTGYSRSLILDYDRKDIKDIKASSLRIKEWDYYLIYNDEYGIALTLADNSYMSLESISILDFKNAREKTVSPIQACSLGKINMPSSSKEGDVVYTSKKIDLSFKHKDNKRILECRMDDFHDKQTFHCYFELDEEPQDSMVIATPFKKEKHFYYNQKIVGFKVSGYFQLGDFKYEFNKNSTRSILDWGRGVWTYKNIWYWGAGCGIVNNHEVGFNIGYGFGDTSTASENAIFYDGILHKLEDITFNIPKDENENYLYTKPWTITSSDKRFEMQFEPILNRASCTDVKLICSDQNQVFGKFNGTMILDDGTKIILKDFLAFAERVLNKW